MSNVHATSRNLINISDDLNVHDIIKTIVEQQTGRYNSFIIQFSGGFQDTTLEMFRWLLYPILTLETSELENGLKYRQIKEIIRLHHPQGQDLNQGNVTQALQAASSLQVKKDIKPIVLDYDQTNLILNIVDKSFLIWLDSQIRKDLLELAGF